MLGFPVSLVPRLSLGTRLAMPAGWSIFRVRDRQHALSLEKFRAYVLDGVDQPASGAVERKESSLA